MAYDARRPSTWRQTKRAAQFNPVKPKGISYEFTTGNRWNVYLDGKQVGVIHELLEGFQYRPAGSKVFGEVFPTQAECRRSLESEA